MDGTLDSETEHLVERAMEIDPVIGQRVAAFAEIGKSPVSADARQPAESPEALKERVRAFAAERTTSPLRSNRSRWPSPRGKAHAIPPRLIFVALLILFLGTAGYFAAAVVPPGGTRLQVAALEHPVILDALETVPSGDDRFLTNGDRLRMIASYRGQDEALCREFSYVAASGSSVVAVACNLDNRWEVRFAIVSAEENGDASPSSLSVLGEFRRITHAGAPLTARQEEEALQALR